MADATSVLGCALFSMCTGGGLILKFTMPGRRNCPFVYSGYPKPDMLTPPTNLANPVAAFDSTSSKDTTRSNHLSAMLGVHACVSLYSRPCETVTPGASTGS